ncbi:sensor histidine kinase [Collimonas fungivorans]|nr:sensor histidine kinase [Collimonas fungivorans]
MTRTLLKSLPFDIAARLPLQLGRESIASSTAAIGELIKNSYDANAENVLITFVKRSAPIQILQIEDDGDGMDLTTLENVWLRIGTEHKVDNERSVRKQRVMTGAKGLGRLGIDRLCKKMILQTKTAEMDHVLEVHINWSRYNSRDATISSINHKIYKIDALSNNKYSSFFKNKTSGTRLILVGLKEKWDKLRLSELRNELSMLVSPFTDVADFSIEFTSGIHHLDGKLSSEKYLDAAVWAIDASLDNEGKIIVSYTQPHKKIGPTPLSVSWQEWLPERNGQPACGPLSLQFYYIPQPSSSVSTSVKRKDWSQFMDLHHGVRVYRDNFRVRPYGEPTGRGDWLDLGLRKASNPSGIRQGPWKVGPRQLLGAIFISRIENSELIDQANREGMVESDAFRDMRAFVLKVLSTFEIIATKYARMEVVIDPVESTATELSESIDKSREAVANLSKAVADSELVQHEEFKEKLEEMERLVAATQAASEKQKAAYDQKREELEREKDTLANLASIGILTVCFGHEAKEFCNLAAAAAAELRHDFLDGKFMVTPEIEIEVLKDIDTIISSTKFVKNFASFSLGNVRTEKRRKSKVSISAVVERVFAALAESLERQKIKVDLSEVSTDLAFIKAYEIDWESIFVNMISNSVWAMAKTEHDKRTIQVKAKNLSSGIEIRFLDSGQGIEKGSEEHIFDPMYSTRRDDRGNTVGTGMGLSIVRTFVNEHSGGAIRALSDSRIGGAEFIITIPVEREQ